MAALGVVVVPRDSSPQGMAGWSGAQGPRVIGRYTNDIVYERLAPGVLEDLRKRNPKLPSGKRQRKHHQWFTPEYGVPKLHGHLGSVTTLMRISDSWEQFMKRLNRLFPKHDKG